MMIFFVCACDTGEAILAPTTLAIYLNLQAYFITLEQ